MTAGAPDGQAGTADLGLVPAMTVRARLAMVKRIPAGAGVSYGHTWTAEKDTTVKRVANLMRGHTIGSVVVVDKGRPVGIVTTSDLLVLLGRGAIKPTPVSKRAPLNYRAPHRKRHRAYGVW